jgi:hypothetical protein
MRGGVAEEPGVGAERAQIDANTETEGRQGELGLPQVPPVQQEARTGSGVGVKPDQRPYAQAKPARPAEEAVGFDRNAPVQPELPMRQEEPKQPVAPVEAPRQGKVVEKATEAPVAPQAQRQALESLRQLYRDATTDAGKALLAKAGGIVSKEPMSNTEYALLSKPGLKPSDVKMIIGARRWAAAPDARDAVGPILGAGFAKERPGLFESEAAKNKREDLFEAEAGAKKA